LVVRDKVNRHLGDPHVLEDVGLSIREGRDKGEDRGAVMIGSLGSQTLFDEPKSTPANGFLSKIFTH
jgi:hypothetical protein